MPNPPAPPAQRASDQQNLSPHNGAPQVGPDLQQQVIHALQPTLAQLGEQMTRTVEQQFEPIRARLQNLAQQQPGVPLKDALQQPMQTGQPEAARDGQIGAPQQNITPQEEWPREEDSRGARHAQQEAEASTQRKTPAPGQEEEVARGAAIWENQREEAALQQWGENLEGAALMVLALGEVLEGVALLLQAISYFRDRGSAAYEDRRIQDSGEEKEDQYEEVRAEGKDEGGPSFLGKIGEAASHSVSSLKEALSHVTGDGPSSQQGLAALEQWGTILERASTLMQDVGKLSKQKEKTGLASMGKWLKIYRSAHSLVDELRQTFGEGASFYQGRGGSGLLSKVEGMVDDASSSGKGSDKDSSEGVQGGASSALKALAGRSSSKKEGSEGGGLLDALTGEDSPLQTLREFSKRQQGPAGLAPKGPIGRKPPPGPMRRDRLPGTRS